MFLSRSQLVGQQQCRRANTQESVVDKLAITKSKSFRSDPSSYVTCVLFWRNPYQYLLHIEESRKSKDLLIRYWRFPAFSTIEFSESSILSKPASDSSSTYPRSIHITREDLPKYRDEQMYRHTLRLKTRILVILDELDTGGISHSQISVNWGRYRRTFQWDELASPEFVTEFLRKVERLLLANEQELDKTSHE
jgi:hypothetical protein